MAEFVKDKYSWNGIKLSTGRYLYANKGLISVNPDFQMGNGYDSPFYYLTYKDLGNEEVYVPDFTKEEVEEIACLMIDMWQRVKERGSWEDW